MSNDSLLQGDNVVNSKTEFATVSVEQLIDEHYAIIYRYAFRLAGNQSDAEDLTQQCFLTAHRKLHQLRDPKAARNWLFQVLRTAFFKLCRKRKPVLAADTEVEMDLIEEVAESDQPYDLEHLQSRLNELPEIYRTILLMFYFEGKSYEAISAALDVPIGTVMSRLSRAKSQLRTRVRPMEPTK